PDASKGIRATIQGVLNRLTGVNRPPIVLLTDPLKDSALCNILRGCDYYVAMGKATTLDIAAIRAGCCGLTIVGMEIPNRPLPDISVHYTNEPVFDAGPFYSPTMNWAVVDMEDLVNVFKKLGS